MVGRVEAAELVHQQVQSLSPPGSPGRSIGGVISPTSGVSSSPANAGPYATSTAHGCVKNAALATPCHRATRCARVVHQRTHGPAQLGFGPEERSHGLRPGRLQPGRVGHDPSGLVEATGVAAVGDGGDVDATAGDASRGVVGLPAGGGGGDGAQRDPVFTDSEPGNARALAGGMT
nr:unnamed protein product [Digitaria exilis]